MRILELTTKDMNQNGYNINFLSQNKIGALFIFPIQSIPKDCLSCDGFVLKISDYNKLFLAIGNKFNTGTEAKDEFRIPDYNITGRFLQPGVKPGEIKEAGLPNIKGVAPTWIANSGFKEAFQYSTTNYHGSPNAALSHNSNSAYDFDASRSNSLYGKSETVQPASQIVSICIKYK